MNFAICDDEKIHRDNMKSLLKEILREIGQSYSVFEYSDGEYLMESFSKNRFDIIFLDLKMSKMHGYETAKKIREIDSSVIIIFITSFFDFVREGYKLKIFRYILKTKLNVELKEAVISAISQKKTDDSSCYVVKSSHSLEVIPLEDIYYFESNKKTVTVFYLNGKLEFYEKISEIERSLLSKGFMKPYKGYVVNVKHITSIKDRNIVLHDKFIIPISRKYYASTLEAVSTSMGGYYGK